jgi:lipopolysaccharide export system ATP-binding protein
LGPNGAGKTTSFYMVVGLIRPDQGQVHLGTEEITSLAIHERARKGIAYLPQEASVFRRLTVEQNLIAALEGRSLSDADRRNQLERLIEDFKLQGIARQKAFTLSGGERRRVEVARALALDPAFLLLDEPFAGIDPIAVTEIQRMMEVLKKRGIGILITDHNVRETLTICDCAYLLGDGKILEKGTPEHLVNSPIARERYLGEGFQF